MARKPLDASVLQMDNDRVIETICTRLRAILSKDIGRRGFVCAMSGGIDSTMFADKTFSNPQTFTYRKVNSLRYHSTLSHSWNDHSKTTATILYRDNMIGQNPAYRVKDSCGLKTGNQPLQSGCLY